MESLEHIVSLIKTVANLQPNVRTSFEGDVYSLDNNRSAKYGVFCITQGQHSENKDEYIFNFSMFYIDRLENNLEANRLQIQSIGMQVISNILRTLDEEYDITVDDHTFQPFTQKFLDECAGQLCTVNLRVFKDWRCPDMYEGNLHTITLTENGTYNVGGYTVKVDVGNE